MLIRFTTQPANQNLYRIILPLPDTEFNILANLHMVFHTIFIYFVQYDPVILYRRQ